MKERDRKKSLLKRLKTARGIEREILKSEKLFYQWIQAERVVPDKKKKASREASRRFRQGRTED
jgi:hypothetical protein